MIQPPLLKKGSEVAIISTARYVHEADLNPAIELLESFGWKVRLGTTIGAVVNQFAGSDERRAADLENMLLDPNIEAIFCARGGYGTIRMLDMVDFQHPDIKPKWVVGFSDMTFLHAYLQQVMGWQSLHAPNLASLHLHQDFEESLYRALTNKEHRFTFKNHPTNPQDFKAISTLWGGNLSILYQLLGSPEDLPKNDENFLLIEEVDEYLYHLDRMLWAFNRNGQLKKRKALLVGGMTDMNDHEEPFGPNALEILQQHAQMAQIPLIYDLPIGHGQQNQAIRMGSTTTLSLKGDIGTLIQ